MNLLCFYPSNHMFLTSCSVISIKDSLIFSEVGITLILCVAVYLSLINKKMPSTSESFPLVSKFYGCVIVEITIAMVCSCYCLHIYDPEGLRLLHFPNHLRVSVLKLIHVDNYQNCMRIISLVKQKKEGICKQALYYILL